MAVDRSNARVALLCGGVGAAKLARGLARQLTPGALTAIVNVGDDFDHWGLRVCPDIDSVIYGLADLHDTERGWGRRDETWSTLGAVKALGGQDWFALGDRDLATHLARTEKLTNGATLTQTIRTIARGFGVTSEVLPATDQPSPTVLTTVDGTTISFQEYFVKLRHAVEIADIAFPSASNASATAEVIEALTTADLIVIAPSNPLLSINPILAIQPIDQVLRERRADVCAVSPLIGGRAIKGPADQLMAQLDYQSDAAGVAALYADFVSTLVIDSADELLADKIHALGCRTIIGDTLMSNDDGQDRVARLCLDAYCEASR